MSPPRSTVSILTVVRNDATGLAATVRSVQRVRSTSVIDLRHIVVDGASTDHTPEVIVTFRASFHAVVSEPDQGIYDAMNKAARLADPGSLLIWINAGDELLPIDDIVRLFDRDEVDAVFAAVRLPNGHHLRPKIRVPFGARTVFPATVFRHQGFLIRRERFQELGGYRLDVGSQADGLLMTEAVRRLRWEASDIPASVFRLDGVSNRRHLAVFQSYLRVVRALGLSQLAVLWFQRSYLLKMLAKIALPSAVTSAIMQARWGS